MAKVITFSRTFPSYHPKAGQPTYFIEKLLDDWKIAYKGEIYLRNLLHLNRKNIQLGKITERQVEAFWKSLVDVDKQKGHTVRAGHRFQIDEYFSPRVWLGVPYNSPQLIIGYDIRIKKTWEFRIIVCKKREHLYLDNTELAVDTVGIIAGNDGLSFVDFMHWFKYPGTPFDGQIICWNENIEY